MLTDTCPRYRNVNRWPPPPPAAVFQQQHQHRHELASGLREEATAINRRSTDGATMHTLHALSNGEHRRHPHGTPRVDHVTCRLTGCLCLPGASSMSLVA